MREERRRALSGLPIAIVGAVLLLLVGKHEQDFRSRAHDESCGQPDLTLNRLLLKLEMGPGLHPGNKAFD
jgi:hypothetical protein